MISIDKYITQPIHLVLSGGGVKGVGLIAVLSFLRERNIEIASISGASSGALVGALFGSGRTTEEMLEFFRQAPLFRYTWLTPRKAGLFDSQKYRSILAEGVVERFEDLSIPLVLSITNLELGRPQYVSKGDLYTPLLASCSVPAVFSPVPVDGQWCVDGGVMDNFPIDPVDAPRERILGSYLSNPAPKDQSQLNSILKITQHSNSLLVHAANRYKFSQTSHTVMLPLDSFGLFDSKKVDEIYESSMRYLEDSYSQDG